MENVCLLDIKTDCENIQPEMGDFKTIYDKYLFYPDNHPLSATFHHNILPSRRLSDGLISL